jgi:hypothetical protein
MDAQEVTMSAAMKYEKRFIIEFFLKFIKKHAEHIFKLKYVKSRTFGCAHANRQKRTFITSRI